MPIIRQGGLGAPTPLPSPLSFASVVAGAGAKTKRGRETKRGLGGNRPLKSPFENIWALIYLEFDIKVKFFNQIGIEVPFWLHRHPMVLCFQSPLTLWVRVVTLAAFAVLCQVCSSIVFN